MPLKKYLNIAPAIALSGLLFATGCAAASDLPTFDPAAFRAWIAEVQRKAVAKGMPEAKVTEALRTAEYLPRVIELDRRQPEFTMTFWQYFAKAISDTRVKRGKELLNKHHNLLSNIEKTYGVQPRFIVAFWGLESNFGDYTGSFPLISSLATLSFDQRRRRFFAEQLLAALEVVTAGDIPTTAKSSWAGAMGNTQFIPTTYRAHAVDFDKDGKRDLWNSLPDVFASSAKFLASSGWDRRHTWGREVALPTGFNFGLSGLETRKKLNEWTALGVTRADGRPLPDAGLEASLIIPAGASGPAFLVYKNFRTTMVWNRSVLYALAVGHLSDRLAGEGRLKATPPADDKAISMRDAQWLQRTLTDMGFDTGGVDGIIGPATRAAIRAYQNKIGTPQDGHADHALIQSLKSRQGQK
ncbi:MAG: lytic murein transglycosylase [Rhodospirillaceae bacterium]